MALVLAGTAAGAVGGRATAQAPSVGAVEYGLALEALCYAEQDRVQAVPEARVDDSAGLAAALSQVNGIRRETLRLSRQLIGPAPMVVRIERGVLGPQDTQLRQAQALVQYMQSPGANPETVESRTSELILGEKRIDEVLRREGLLGCAAKRT